MKIVAGKSTGCGGGTLYLGITLLILTLVAVILMAFFRQRLAEGEAKRATQLPVLGQVSNFSLTNQLGETITLSNLLGTVWVGDIVFTRCAGPCPRMTRQMSELQELLAKDSPVRLVTLTTDPAFDTPEVMRRYGEKYGAKPDRWWLLTGSKAEIARLAVEGLRLTAIETKENERTDPADLFIHSTIFVVVDKQGRLRAVVETQDDVVEESNNQPGPSKWQAESKAKLAGIVRQLVKE
jgi:cytochrome oxidase Cu insertion factor (SCO1/SenC/PrrC family)